MLTPFNFSPKNDIRANVLFVSQKGEILLANSEVPKIVPHPWLLLRQKSVEHPVQATLVL
jgi:hypothetical protein